MAKNTLGMLAAVTLLFAAPVAMADSGADDEPKVVYEKHTVLIFDGQVLNGSLQEADIGFILARLKIHHEDMIRVRRDFRPELLGSAHLLPTR